MPEGADVPQIDSIMFGDRVVVIEYLEPRNTFPDGGTKHERLVIPVSGREDLINELIEDATELLDDYLTAVRNPDKTIRGRGDA